MGEASMRVEITHGEADPDHVVLRVFGEVDIAAGSDLRSAVENQAVTGVHLVIDLAGVSFMDSTGVSAILSGSRMARGLGRRLVVCGAQQQVSHLLAIVMLDSVVPVCVDLKDAIACLELEIVAAGDPPLGSPGPT